MDAGGRMAVLWDKNMAVRPGPRAGSRPSRALFAGVAGRMGQGPEHDALSPYRTAGMKE
jgi:hypothetical protein